MAIHDACDCGHGYYDRCEAGESTLDLLARSDRSGHPTAVTATALTLARASGSSRKNGCSRGLRGIWQCLRLVATTLPRDLCDPFPVPRYRRRRMLSSLTLRDELTVIDAGDSRWLEFIASRADALAFHHPAWGRLVQRAYGFRPLALAAIDETGRVAAGTPVLEISHLLRPRKWVSLPFADYSPPLAPADTEGFAEALDRTRRIAGVASIEIRSTVEGANVHRRSRGVRHVLQLQPDCDELFRAFRPATRRNVRQAERSGIEVRRCDEPRGLVDDFYRMHTSNRRRLGTPVQPRRFFRDLWEEVIEPGLGFVLLATRGETPVAGAVFLSWNGTIVYKYGASDPRAWSARPNNLVMWDAIRWGAENGYHTFDFGRSEIGQEGLRSFKAGWGATELPLEYSVIAERAPTDNRAGASSALSPLIRRSPTWVARILGEFFYRYAA